MASLVKMQILGLRSFGPDENDIATVTFNTPLTLILGQNGCGKTTIIEALKYATCGELPANTDKGSGFVHDPKIINRVEVRGQVKLVCTTTKGEQICISRSVSVQQNRRKLNFKTLDSTITRWNKETEQKESLSGRCADIDSEMCYRLGVTKPILNYVIFCHQEDSCWPLEENKKLKEKFDAIFDATKYTKCLDYMRKERKNRITELKILQNSLVYLQKFKEDTQKKRQVLEDTNEKLDQTNREIVDLAESAQPIAERISKLKESEASGNELHTEREKLKSTVEELQKSKKELLKTITQVFEGTDQELETAIKGFEEDSSEKKIQLNDLESKNKDLTSELRQLQKQVDKKRTEQGKLASDEEAYQKKIINRNRDVTIIAKKLDLTALNTTQMSSTGTETTETLEQIRSKLDESNASLEVLRISHEEEENQLQEQIHTCRDKKIHTEAGIKTKTEQLKKAEQDYKKVTNDIYEADESVNTLRMLEDKLERVDKELEELNQNFNYEELEKTIEVQKNEKNNLKDEVNVLEKNLDNLRSLQEDQNRLDEWQKNKADREVNIQRLKNKHGDLLQHLLGHIPEQRIKGAFKDRVDALNRDIRAKKKAFREKNDKLIRLKTNRKNKGEKLAEMQNDLRTKENEVYELTENKDYDTLLAEITEEIRRKQDLKGTWYGTEYLYKKYIKKLDEQNPCCPLCHRDFDSQQEAVELVEELNNNVSGIPQRSMEVAKQLDGLLDKQARLQQLKPIIDKVASLKNIEIPALESELTDIDQDIEKLQGESTALENDLIEPEQDVANADDAKDDIAVLEKEMNDLRNLDRKITDLQDKLGARTQGVSYNEVSEEYKKKKESLEEVGKNLDNNQTKLQVQSKKLKELNDSKNKLVEKQLDLKSKSLQRAELAEKQSELEGLRASLRHELDEEKEKLQPLKSDLKKLEDEKKTKHKQNLKALDEERNAIKKNEELFQAIKKLQHDIEEYEKSDGTTKANTMKEELNALEQQKEDLEKQRNDLMEKIKEIGLFVSNLEGSRQNLNNNKILRAKHREEKSYSEEIDQLGVQLGSLNLQKLKKDKYDLMMEEEKIKRKEGLAQGRAEELEIKIRELETELEKDDYKNADANHRNLFIELRVKAAALEDIGNYVVALDWAMIHFHKERMKTINTIIRNLWRQIYSGNDIDTIEIKTEESDTNTADKKRTFNYRVICKRGDIEMDMRGRCSAGQKVLACLIIRMALAETFSKNCGILALDEPTTNLDQENIDSLSSALADIISYRSKQKNFQLIVITHDEDFLLRLSHNEKITSYLKVQRNNRGKSEVKEITV